MFTGFDDKGTTKKRNGVLFRSSPFCSFRIFSYFFVLFGSVDVDAVFLAKVLHRYGWKYLG